MIDSITLSLPCPPARAMVLAAEQCWHFTDGDVGLLPLYAAVHPLPDPERIADLMQAVREFLRDAS